MPTPSPDSREKRSRSGPIAALVLLALPVLQEFHRIQMTHDVDLDEHLAQIDEAVEKRRGEQPRFQNGGESGSAG